MTNAKSSLQHPGQNWNGIFNFLRSRKVNFASNANDSGGGYGQGSSNSEYDELKNVKVHEVTRAKKLILPQLRDDVCVYDIQPNFICDLFLDNSLADCPPEIFGRVVDKYPPFDPV